MMQKFLTGIRNPLIRAAWRRRLSAEAAIRMRRIFHPHPARIRVGNRAIGDGGRVFVVAEIGVNHNGSLERAKSLIDAAADAGADAVKFQKRSLYDAYQRRVVDSPEQNEQSFQYLIPLLKEYELGESDYRALAAHAEKKNMLFFATPFDEASVDFLERVIAPPIYKIASADLIAIPLIERILETQKPIILSTGMATSEEIDHTAALLHRSRARFILMHTHSAYPAPVDHLNLAMIKALRRRYGVPVGYSGHELGIEHTLQAVALGACVVERHITLDRDLPGPDHSASLEPAEFAALVRGIRNSELALGAPTPRISRGEVANRLTLRKSIVAAADIPAGARITRPMLTAKSPGSGLSPQRLYDLIGRRVGRDMKQDEMFGEADLTPGRAPRVPLPAFKTRWGIKIRFNELAAAADFAPAPAIFEFHMSDRDLSYPFDPASRYTQELFVHAPEYWGTDIVDLASENERVQEQSIRVIQKTIDKTRAISPSFRGTPKIVIHIGGMTLTPHPNPRLLLERAKDAFRRLDRNGIEMLPENLPPFGWFFSGLWHCNIFGSVEDLGELCDEFGLSACLDLSHAWLFSTHRGIDYFDYIRALAPRVIHLHVADGRGSHKEGLQISEGDVPFEKTFALLGERLASPENISWVPEIWQGYLNNYEGFKKALAALARYPLLRA